MYFVKETHSKTLVSNKNENNQLQKSSFFLLIIKSQ